MKVLPSIILFTSMGLAALDAAPRTKLNPDGWGWDELAHVLGDEVMRSRLGEVGARGGALWEVVELPSTVSFEREYQFKCLEHRGCNPTPHPPWQAHIQVKLILQPDGNWRLGEVGPVVYD